MKWHVTRWISDHGPCVQESLFLPVSQTPSQTGLKRTKSALMVSAPHVMHPGVWLHGDETKILAKLSLGFFLGCPNSPDCTPL